MLAQLIPEDPGEPGMNVFGVQIKPRAVKRAVLKFGHNIALSEDRMSITSQVDGHVMLVGDKVFVSNIYEVENVDNSTGNIDFEGSVQVNGNVCSGFAVSARGNHQASMGFPPYLPEASSPRASSSRCAMRRLTAFR